MLYLVAIPDPQQRGTWTIQPKRAITPDILDPWHPNKPRPDTDPNDGEPWREQYAWSAALLGRRLAGHSGLPKLKLWKFQNRWLML